MNMVKQLLLYLNLRRKLYKQNTTAETAVVFSLSCLADNVEIWYNLYIGTMTTAAAPLQ